MKKYMKVNKDTRVIAKAGSLYVLTNDPNFDINNITMSDVGCIVDVENETMSPELPILVLTKNEAFYSTAIIPDLSHANEFEKVM